MSHTYRYYIPDHGEDADDCCEFDSKRCVTPDSDEWDKELLAEQAAEDLHDNHDGWECSWPLVLVLLTADGLELGSFEVEREHTPTFNAGRVRSADRTTEASA